MVSSGRKFAASNTRNICIVGHVDHGKSSYADSLLAANNIISARMAGKMRYLDSREDEQERGITMESSAVSLNYRTLRKGPEGGEPSPEDYMINLIDTPGHVDFSSEVSTASRLCDGALVMVDAVEGVCTQTITVLRQAWMERLKPILVINKLDRIITELRLAPIEAHHHLTQLIEQVNAVMGSFHASERMDDDLRWREERARRLAQKKEKLQDAAAGQANVDAEASISSNDTALNEDNDEDEEQYEERDDEDLYFAPEQGNVIFASAIDGWAFRISQFAQIHAKRLGIKGTNLRKVLWGDFYLDPKTKRVLSRKHLGKRSLKPMFVQFVLENIWAVYDSVILNPNPDKTAKIIAALGVKIRPQELKTKEHRTLSTAILSQWLPLAPATFRAVVEIIPQPSQAQAIRIPKMLHPELLHSQLDVKPENKLEEDMYHGNAGDDAFIVAYVSKMFAVPAKSLPQNQKKAMTAEEMRQRGRASREAAAALAATGAVVVEEALPLQSNGEVLNVSEDKQEQAEVDEDAEVLLGFSRLYSGTLRAGQTVYAILPKYNASLPPTHPRNSKFISAVKVEYLYMMMGRDLVMVDEVPSGNVFAAAGLEGKILRNGTLCGIGAHDVAADLSQATEHRECFVNLAGLNLTSAPIVRVALEPRDPSDMPKLVEGLRLLNQADSCVETLVQETGEHVILTAGELHLERCLRDLRERFAKIEIQASPPIVPFRETAVQAAEMAPPKTKDAPRGTINGSVLNGVVTFTVRAKPLPADVTKFLIHNMDTVRRVVQNERDLTAGGDHTAPSLDDVTAESASAAQQGDAGGSIAQMNPTEFWKQLDALFAAAGKDWADVTSKIWAFGPRRIGPNILVDRLPGVTRSLQNRSQASKTSKGTTPARAGSPSPDESQQKLDIPEDLEENDQGTVRKISIRSFDDSIDTAFQLSTLRGPLCNEPVQGMAYFVEEIEIDETAENAEHLQTRFSQATGSMIASAQDAFKQGLLDWSPRLLLAMYSCDIQASTDVLGKVYGVVARRRGRIVSEEMKEGTSFFTISALLPVIESFNFADEIRTKSSGAASPQLVFHGYEMLDEDPFWVPTTEEELEDLGEKADRENVARRYMDSVRKRKGLFVEKKVVEHAEKQRTLKR